MLPSFVISRRHRPRLPRPCRGASRGPSSLLSPPAPQELLLCKFSSPMTLLDATLMHLPSSVANKRLTVWLNPLDATLTKNRGRGADYGQPSIRNKPPSFFPRSVSLRLCGCPALHSPYTLPSSVSRNSFVCHSYENCRGVYQQFPIWFVPLSIGNAERKDRARQAPPYTYRGWRCERSAKI